MTTTTTLDEPGARQLTKPVSLRDLVNPHRVHTFKIGDVLSADQVEQIDEFTRDEILLPVGVSQEQLDLDESDEEETELGSLGFEPGTADDPRLEGHPGANKPINVILEWVDGDAGRAEAAYDREQRRGKKARPGLVEPLLELID